MDFSQANVQNVGNNAVGVDAAVGPGGVVNLGNTPINTTELDLYAATLTTTASIKTNIFNFGGTLNGSGAVEVTGSLTISPNYGGSVNTPTLDGRTLTLDSTGSATFARRCLRKY